jgi:electron transfer flavoprotein alpha subunit
VGEVDTLGALRPIAWEMLTAARQVAGKLGGAVTALLMGSGIGEAARAWGSAGADRLLVADDERLAPLTAGAAASVLEQAVNTVSPVAVLVPGTTVGRDCAPLAAAQLGAGLAPDCIALEVADSTLTAVRPVYGGRAMTRVRFSGSPALVTIRAGCFDRAEAGATTPGVEPLPFTLSDDDLRVSVLETAPKGEGNSRLDTAEVVVSGGRGLKEPANFALVEELATALGGAVGATRAVVDAGWRPHQEQIGQTGRTVSPRLYVAVGVSGAVQHNVGMQGSDYIVAINRDPDAPIFKIASFGIVGDLFEVVPAVTTAVRDAKS